MVAETARELAETHNTRVTPIECDIRLPDAVENMMTRVFNEGPLSGLVNNAAGNFISRTKDLSPNGFNAIANIVLHGTFYVTLAAGKRWIEARQQANVVSILTTSVWNGGPFTVPSAMSKAGINVMTKSLAVEWAPRGIRLNAIAPGLFPTKGAGERLNPGSIRSGTIDKAQDASGTIPMGRVGQMQELRNLATFLMADGCSSPRPALGRPRASSSSLDIARVQRSENFRHLTGALVERQSHTALSSAGVRAQVRAGV